MPNKPLKPCKYLMCRELVEVGTSYCITHQRQRNNESKRNSTRHWKDWYSMPRWRTIRLHWLNANPLCVMCLADNKVVAATVVDHIQDHKGDKSLFLDVNNLQSLCVRCHNSKTAKDNNKHIVSL